jgi:hypothetical protein
MEKLKVEEVIKMKHIEQAEKKRQHDILVE